MADSLNWQLLSSEYIVNDRWLKLRADRCRLPNSNLIEPYYVLEYPAWVNVVAVTPQAELLLVKLYRHGLGQIGLEIPAGGVEPADQSPLDAARRELLEETGYGGGEFVEIARLSPNAANHTNLVHCFLATEVELLGQPAEEETERLELVRLPIREVVQLLKSNSLLQALQTSCLWFALARLGKISFEL